MCMKPVGEGAYLTLMEKNDFRDLHSLIIIKYNSSFT